MERDIKAFNDAVDNLFKNNDLDKFEEEKINIALTAIQEVVWHRIHTNMNCELVGYDEVGRPIFSEYN